MDNGWQPKVESIFGGVEKCVFFFEGEVEEPLHHQVDLEGFPYLLFSHGIVQVKLSCGFGLVVWVFLITLYFDQRKNAKTLINLKNHQEKIKKGRHKHDKTDMTSLK